MQASYSSHEHGHRTTSFTSTLTNNTLTHSLRDQHSAWMLRKPTNIKKSIVEPSLFFHHTFRMSSTTSVWTNPWTDSPFTWVMRSPAHSPASWAGPPSSTCCHWTRIHCQSINRIVYTFQVNKLMNPPPPPFSSPSPHPDDVMDTVNIRISHVDPYRPEGKSVLLP